MNDIAIKQQTQLAQSVTPDQMLMIAIEKGADLDRLEKLMDLKERWDANEARKAFVEAMNQFKADPPRVGKNKTVGFGKTEYKHATLDHVCDVIGSALSKVGISYRWETNQDGGLITVRCVLTHKDGHSESVMLSASPDTSGSKNGIQAVGSTVTYLQRYTLLSATGMATAEQDDDGAAGAAEGLLTTLDDIASAATLKDLESVFKAAWVGYGGNTSAIKRITAAKDARKKELQHG